ncbi:unnamed protein product [Gordionus sp. m RMFG-2023]
METKTSLLSDSINKDQTPTDITISKLNNLINPRLPNFKMFTKTTNANPPNEFIPLSLISLNHSTPFTNKTNVIEFNFKTPKPTIQKPSLSLLDNRNNLNFQNSVITVVPAEKVNVMVYTPLNLLTDEEKQQYIARDFDIGKIPIQLPPIEYC